MVQVCSDPHHRLIMTYCKLLGTLLSLDSELDQQTQLFLVHKAEDSSTTVSTFEQAPLAGLQLRTKYSAESSILWLDETILTVKLC